MWHAWFKSNVVPAEAMKAYKEWRYSSTHSLYRQYKEVKDQLDSTAAWTP
jgi:hypothetical protein